MIHNYSRLSCLCVQRAVPHVELWRVKNMIHNYSIVSSAAPDIIENWQDLCQK